MRPLPDFGDVLGLRPDPVENLLSDEAVARVLANSGRDLTDEFQVIEALWAVAIRPQQVGDLNKAVAIARAMPAVGQENVGG